MILDGRTNDTRLLHHLINKQREKQKYCVNELSVNGEVLKTDTEILQGWQQQFSALATPSNDADFDVKYRQQVHCEIAEIMDICSSCPEQGELESITFEQVKEAISCLNKGKAPDYHGVQAEHLLY